MKRCLKRVAAIEPQISAFAYLDHAAAMAAAARHGQGMGLRLADMERTPPLLPQSRAEADQREPRYVRRAYPLTWPIAPAR